ncbi:hypothetical protein H6P81_017434 [Aristolochia fimbriata]|uniref:Uncharacterized protein n=1 Tax=Aristolochia fimbriata TaxID=158543 RepID=A0AAV7E050_ARIFI|nr:hypothetical protein H6P81_017434 [Aristolochia fimbriata]
MAAARTSALFVVIFLCFGLLLVAALPRPGSAGRPFHESADHGTSLMNHLPHDQWENEAAFRAVPVRTPPSPRPILAYTIACKLLVCITKFIFLGKGAKSRLLPSRLSRLLPSRLSRLLPSLLSRLSRLLPSRLSRLLPSRLPDSSPPDSPTPPLPTPPSRLPPPDTINVRGG